MPGLDEIGLNLQVDRMFKILKEKSFSVALIYIGQYYRYLKLSSVTIWVNQVGSKVNIWNAKQDILMKFNEF